MRSSSGGGGGGDVDEATADVDANITTNRILPIARDAIAKGGRDLWRCARIAAGRCAGARLAFGHGCRSRMVTRWKNAAPRAAE